MNVAGFESSLFVMVQGMAGIFLVSGFIIGSIVLLNLAAAAAGRRRARRGRQDGNG